MQENTENTEYNTVDEKVTLIFDIIKSIENENISNILFNSLGQGLNLIVSLFDENGEYKVDKSKETIDTIEVFESFFNIKLDNLILKYMEDHQLNGDKQTDFVADSAITDIITGDDTNVKSDEDYKADIKEKLNFINSVIDGK